MSSLRNRSIRVSASAVLFCMASLLAQNAFAFRLYTVGSDAACSFSDLQQAIDNATDADGNSILIAQDGDYSATHVRILGQNIALLGGLAQCDSSVYAGQTTLHGVDTHSVIEIEGNNNVYLGNLVLTGATMDETHEGGGIYFQGRGALELSNTAVTFNTTGYGGGIDVNGSDGPLSLKLDSNTYVLSNTALVSGGGIRLEGNSSLYMTQLFTIVAFNEAPNGYGGGIEVIGPSAAHIGSVSISGNTAAYGGGIAVIGGEGDELDAFAGVFTTDPGTPADIFNNIATATGGGVYVSPTVTTDTGGQHLSRGTFCAYQFRIDDNIAQEGSALYADSTSFNLGLDHTGADVTLTSLASQGCDYDAATATHLGEVACADGVACNTMHANIAEDSGGNPTGGATILVQDEGSLTVYGLRLQASQGGYAIRTLDGIVDMQNALVTDNAFSSAALAFEDDGDAARYTTLRGLTIANNSIGATSAIWSAHPIGLYTSIIDQPGLASIATSDASLLTADYILAADTDGLPDQDGILLGSPAYADAGAGNYHLQRTSLGVDIAPAGGGGDLDGKPRDVNLGDIPDVWGPRDLGVYEIQDQLPGSCFVADTIWCNGFEP